MHTDAQVRKAGGRLSREDQRRLGDILQRVYDDVLRQGVPDRFKELLNELDKPKEVGDAEAIARWARPRRTRPSAARGRQGPRQQGIEMMTMRTSVRDAMLAAVPSLRAFAISLCGNVDRADDLVQETLLRAMANIDSFQPGTNMSAWLFTILRNLFRSEYRKRRREVEDTDGSYAESLKSHPEQHSRVEFEEFRVALAQAAAGPARSAHPRRRVGLLLRGGGRHLRLRGRNDQEPGQSRAHAALGSALHRRRGRLRSGSHHAGDSVGGRAQLITHSAPAGPTKSRRCKQVKSSRPADGRARERARLKTAN